MKLLDQAISKCAAQCKAAATETCQKIASDELRPIGLDVAKEIKRALWVSVALTAGYIVYDRFIR